MAITVPTVSESRPIVYTKTTWAGAWIAQPLMRALTVAVQAAPGHSSATLLWKYGSTKQPEIGDRAADKDYTSIPRGDFLGNYVRIEFLDQVWWGVIQDVEDDNHGLIDGTIPKGVQLYTAFGLTWFLDNGKPITQSKVKYLGGTFTIDRAIPFNGGTDGARRKNSVAWKNYDSTEKCFTDRGVSATPAAWKASTAIEYILANFTPRNAAGATLVPFVLASDAASFLDYELPLVDYDGLTPWQLITRLVDHRRGLLLLTKVVDNSVQLVVRSQNATSITLPSGGTIPANPDQMSYNFDNAVNVKAARVSTTLVRKYDQVICLGERAGSVFTVRPGVNFEADWTGAQATAYNAGASALAGYSGLSTEDKAAANADRRAADDLERVFSWWRASLSWNGRSATDPSGGSPPFAFPSIDADGTVTTSSGANVQRGGLRVADFIPLRAGVDYTAAAITPDTDGSDDADADYLPPILLLKATAIRAGGSDGGWVHAERLNAGYDSESDKRQYTFSVDLQTREDSFGLIFKTQGAPQHFICRDLFTGPDSSDSVPASESLTSTSWLATVYVKQDQYCRAQYPKQADLPALDLIRPLVLRFENAFLDYVVPGTVLGVKAGELQKTSAGGFVRDDRKRLEDMARLAYAWHGQTRRILSLQFRGLTSGFEVGHLITTIGRGANVRTINTAITSVQYDLERGGMSVQTQFAEMDFRR
ncbi:hypothetical protein EKK58_12285 [Candidatus Dependentiae bacterium]|nr:MAG: hypothetical protein EKK58_12285 [Candidatus Dependentiae bacterium]